MWGKSDYVDNTDEAGNRQDGDGVYPALPDKGRQAFVTFHRSFC